MASYWCAASMNMRQSLVLDSAAGLRFLYNSPITSVNTAITTLSQSALARSLTHSLVLLLLLVLPLTLLQQPRLPLLSFSVYLTSFQELLQVGQMVFLTFNQQCQSTEVNTALILTRHTQSSRFTYLYELR